MFSFFLIHRISEFPWISSSTSLEIVDIIDIILCLPVRCVKKKLKRSQQRFSLFHRHRLVVFMHLHWDSTIQHVSSGSSGNFPNTNGAKWCKIQIHAVKHGMFQKPRIKHPMYINVWWWRHSCKMVKIPRLQVGNKKNQVHKTCRQYAWNWLRMIEDVGHLGHIQPPGSRMLLRKPPVCNGAGLNFESSFRVAFQRGSLGSAVIRRCSPFVSEVIYLKDNSTMKSQVSSDQLPPYTCSS